MADINRTVSVLTKLYSHFIHSESVTVFCQETDTTKEGVR